MIEDLLPAPIATEETFHDLPSSGLFPQEEALVARSTEERRREFATVRVNARKALAELGFSPAPILPGVRGAPRWPTNVVGSMTHCEGYRAAAVAHTDDMKAIGVDAEPNKSLPGSEVLKAVTIPEERLWLSRLKAQRPDVFGDRLVFSAKESCTRPGTRSPAVDSNSKMY
jgi:4'-phosphopantetheinyl transferase EntD